MCAKKSYNLGGQKELLTIYESDQALSLEQVEDLEGPVNPDKKLELPDLSKVREVLRESGWELIGDRESCSGGAFGPIFKLKVREMTSGKELFLMERTFTEMQDIERRFGLVEIESVPSSHNNLDSEPRYELINQSDHHQDKLIIDYLYNEARALKELQAVKGVPKFYGAVYDDLNGSILTEFIDGPDLSMIVLRGKQAIIEWNVPELLEKVKKIYTAAAEAGFIHHNPVGATIMIGPDREPYLADWYLYAQGRIDAESPIRDKYLQGLRDIEEFEKMLLTAE